MLFNALSVFGLVASAAAAPALHSRFEQDVKAREATEPAGRGLTWTPARSVKSRNKSGNKWSNFGSNIDISSFVSSEQIQILEFESNSLDQQQLQDELLFVEAIQEQLLANEQLMLAEDNIRINTFNNINSQVNTVLVIVTQINDKRGGNSKKRYMARQRQSNSQITETVFVQINEIASMDINNNLSQNSSGQSNNNSSSNQFNSPSVGSYSAGSSLNLGQGISLLPDGSEQPNFNNAQNYVDPAIIIQQNQQMFVEVVGNSDTFTDVTIAVSSS